MSIFSKAKQKESTITKKPLKANSYPSGQQLQEMIAEAAYYKAEQRDFIQGLEDLDWFEAEKEVTAVLHSK